MVIISRNQLRLIRPSSIAFKLPVSTHSPLTSFGFNPFISHSETIIRPITTTATTTADLYQQSQCPHYRVIRAAPLQRLVGQGTVLCNAFSTNNGSSLSIPSSSLSSNRSLPLFQRCHFSAIATWNSCGSPSLVNRHNKGIRFEQTGMLSIAIPSTTTTLMCVTLIWSQVICP